jgi:hypothetical protein
MLRPIRFRELLLILILPICGCQTSPTASPTAAPSEPVQPKEFWDAIYFGNSKVGYAHTVYETTELAGRQIVNITADSEITVLRFGQTSKQTLRYHSQEMGSELVSFDSSMSSSDSTTAPISLEVNGSRQGDELELQLKTMGKTQTAKLPWNKTWGGYFALEQTLESSPLRPGEKRTLRALMPGFNQTADIELEAEQIESVETLDGPRELLRIQCKIKLGENPLEQILWTDPSGQTIKSFMPTLQQITYRTSKEKALQPGTGTFDLGEKTIVKLDREIEQPHQMRRAVYRATLAAGNIRTAFAAGETQLVRPMDEHTAELVVRALRPDDELGDEFPPGTPATERDLSPNSLIQSDDAEVITMAQGVAADQTDPWAIAVALEQKVRESITNKNFSQALSSAAEVVRAREGDCTEHAVLLAALCRARKIPSRVSIGLVYHRPSRGFAYHMWTDVWIKDRWIPIDGTLGLGGIGAGHLAVSHSNLEGVDSLTQFLPVLQLIGNLKLELVSVE